MNNMKLEVQLPLVDVLVVFRLFHRVVLMIIRRTILPDSNRITVKLAASIASLPSANRHNTELAANAINAKPVRTIVLNKALLIKFYP